MDDLALTTVRGIGPKKSEQLNALGITGVTELLRYLPRDYLDYSVRTPVASLAEGRMQAAFVRINEEPKTFRYAGMTVVSARASDETGEVTLKWFNQPYRRTQVHAGMQTCASGRVSMKKGRAMLNPALTDELPGILPVYALTKGVTQRTVRDAMLSALKTHFNDIAETLPEPIRTKYGLCSLQLALRHVHFPATRELLQSARRRLDFEDMLCYLLAVETEKRERRRRIGVRFAVDGMTKRYEALLPFSLTGAQKQALDEIARDMGDTAPMNRLLQGDVGSGKTAVAFFALYTALQNGKQGVLLAPTEILSEQHFSLAKKLFGDAAVLLTGGMRKKERAEALERIASGEAKCIIGTHALFQEDVRFSELSLVITDEQHRFGVHQRAAMQDKGICPDVLVMSATPIPRTLALLLYGDLDVSVLDELPPGRKPIKTRIIGEKKRVDMYRYLANEAKAGRQTYIVCPLIDTNEEIDAPSVESIAKALRALLPETRIAVLTGRMRDAEKNRVIEAFRAGETDFLVSTTVVEVGVHVEHACYMVIEGADRFGLSQLHQLRGRVGRGSEQAYCFLLGQSSEAAQERMTILTETNDGFLIADRDLLLRGPGDFLGTRQHGDGDAVLLSHVSDVALLKMAKEAAKEVMELPNDASNEVLRYAMRRYREGAERVAMN